MELKIQFISLSFSFLYGMFFSFLINLNYSLLYNSKKNVQLLISIFFILDNVLLYFLILQKINNGIIHIYLMIAFLSGVFIEHVLGQIIAKFKKE